MRGRLRTGFVFAQGGLLSNQSLRENLALPLRFAGWRGAELDREVDGALERFGLSEQAALRPHALGARARKLAQWARVDLLSPDAVFLCEPFEDLEGADLDLASGLLRAWAADPARLVLATAEHAPADLLQDARRLRLEAGRIHSVEEAR